jgi:hypothetical protein
MAILIHERYRCPWLRLALAQDGGQGLQQLLSHRLRRPIPLQQSQVGLGIERPPGFEQGG